MILRSNLLYILESYYFYALYINIHQVQENISKVIIIPKTYKFNLLFDKM